MLRNLTRRRNSRYCHACKQDMYNCRKDAEDNDWLDYHNEQASNDVTFFKMISEYRKQRPQRGAGAKRKKFDVMSYRKATYAKTETTSQLENKMMDYIDFHNHHTQRHESEQRIQELWDKALQNKDIHKFVDAAGKATHVA
eukprot:5648604-Alexandrium_andersonii.AAC.1